MDSVPDIYIFFGRFHSLLVHLPLGFLVLALVLEFIEWRRKSGLFSYAIQVTWWLAVISGIVSVVLGLALASAGGYNDETLGQHKTSGIVLVLLSICCLAIFMLRRRRATRSVNFVYAILVVLVGVSLVITGHLGGALTHGSNYLTEYAPSFISGAPESSAERGSSKKRISSLDSADIFSDAVLPIIQTNCASCHNKEKKKGKLLLTSYEEILAGGETREGVVPGNIATSELFRRITLPEDHKEFMPADGKKPLNEAQVAILKFWIEAGAPRQALVPELHPSARMQAILQDFFQVGRDEMLDLVVPAASNKAIRELLKAGFSVNQITPKQNLYEVKLTSKTADKPDFEKLNGLREQLVWLQLINCGLTDEDLKVIARLKNLYRLNLSNNPISDTGISYLGNLPKLRTINLYRTSVSNSSVKALVNLPSLQRIYVAESKVDTLQLNGYLPPRNIEVIYKVEQ